MKPNDEPLLFRLIFKAVIALSPKFTLCGEENIPDGPCVLVGNHSQMYGPIAGAAYIPGKPYIWCAGEMMDKSLVADYAFEDFWSKKPGSVRWFFRVVSRIIPPLSAYIFTNARTIAVYRGTKAVNTLRESIAKLKEDCKILVFPEGYEPYNNIVYRFRNGFVDMGRLYAKVFENELTFVPTYIAPKLKIICFGKPIAYNRDNDYVAERERICEELMKGITVLASELPCHRVVPYPNISKKQYQYSQPVIDRRGEQ